MASALKSAECRIYVRGLVYCKYLSERGMARTVRLPIRNGARRHHKPQAFGRRQVLLIDVRVTD
jgi:hypothetical protein